MLYSYGLVLFVQAYAVDPRMDWVREWPGQVAICVNQIYWTAEVHEAIRSGPQGLRDYHQKLKAQVSIFNKGVVLMIGRYGVCVPHRVKLFVVTV